MRPGAPRHDKNLPTKFWPPLRPHKNPPQTRPHESSGVVQFVQVGLKNHGVIQKPFVQTAQSNAYIFYVLIFYVLNKPKM